MERVQEDGVRLTEEELEERRQELLAKAEIQVRLPRVKVQGNKKILGRRSRRAR